MKLNREKRMKNMWMVLGLALSMLLVGCLDGGNYEDTLDAGEVDKNIVTTPKGLGTSPVEANVVVPPEENIITPGCDGPETDPYRVCEGDGGGGSGTGGGGGGTGGGGGSTPPSCPWGFDWSPYYNSCVFSLRYTTCGYRSGSQCSYTHLGSCECYNVGSPNPECDSSLDCPGSTYCGDLGLCARAP
jgi:hypothetical protein